MFSKMFGKEAEKKSSGDAVINVPDVVSPQQNRATFRMRIFEVTEGFIGDHFVFLKGRVCGKPKTMTFMMSKKKRASSKIDFFPLGYLITVSFLLWLTATLIYLTCYLRCCTEEKIELQLHCQPHNLYMEEWEGDVLNNDNGCLPFTSAGRSKEVTCIEDNASVGANSEINNGPGTCYQHYFSYQAWKILEDIQDYGKDTTVTNKKVLRIEMHRRYNYKCVGQSPSSHYLYKTTLHRELTTKNLTYMSQTYKH